METYLINPKEFKGYALAILKDGKSIYSGKTKKDYEQEYKAELSEFTWDELYDNYIVPYDKSLQKPFKEITEDQWHEMLNVLPPMRWTKHTDGSFFFVSEAYRADLHGCYVSKGGKYYTAVRSKFEKTENIINLKNVK